MKVLQINSVCGTGSTGRIAVDLYKVLESQGHECKIAYGRGDAPNGINTIKIGNKIDNYWHLFKTRVFDKHGFGSRNATKKFIKKIKEYDPDIIHLHNLHGYYINIEILFDFLKNFSKPVVWTLHDCWAFTGHCSHFDYIGCDRWKEKCHSCPQKIAYPASKFFDNSKFNYEKKKELFTSIKNMTIVTPSTWLANLVKKSFLKKYDIKVINNGIDLDIFKPTKSNFRKKYNIEEKIILLGVANIWSERKGLKYFIDLSKELRDDYKIVLVGVSKRQKKYLPNSIIAINRTDSIKELVEIYTSADVFINPTLEEVLGMTNLEALACGTPVITFDTGGSPECIDNTCGFVVDKGNMNSICNIVENIDKFTLTEYCICKAKNYNNIDKSNEYIKLYYEIKEI